MPSQFPRTSSVRRWSQGVAVAFGVCGVVLTVSGRDRWQPASGGPMWPPAPDIARVKYVASISGPSDIGAGPSILGRVFGFIAGRRLQPRLLRPSAVTSTANGAIVVADPGQQMVHVFDPARRRYSYLDPAPFASPVGLAAAGDLIYVADSGRRRVFVYGGDGRLRRTLGVVNGEPIFVRPTAVAVDHDGRLVVLDAGGCSVTVMSPDGAVERVFGRRGSAPGEFNVPTHMTLGRDGRLYVVDAMNARVQVFERDGTLAGGFGRRGNGSGDLDKPKGIALDGDGHVYVVEGLHDVLQVFDKSGRLLLVVGASGSGSGQFALPSGLHIDDGGRIFVADSLNGRVQVFQYVSSSEAD